MQPAVTVLTSSRHCGGVTSVVRKGRVGSACLDRVACEEIGEVEEQKFDPGWWGGVES